MIKGIVSGHLLPMIPVSLKKLDEDWQNLNILLDTGSEVGFMLPMTTASQYGIAIRLDYNSPASIVSVQRLGNSMPISPCWVELQLEGYPSVVEVQIIDCDDFERNWPNPAVKSTDNYGYSGKRDSQHRQDTGAYRSCSHPKSDSQARTSTGIPHMGSLQTQRAAQTR